MDTVLIKSKPPNQKLKSTRHAAYVKEFLDNSSIHGLRYLTEPGRHWVERLFWAIICTLSLVGTYELLVASWNAFQYSAVSFVSETAYLDWNTTFPAVSVCETESPDKLYESATKVFGVQRNRNLDFFLRDIVFFDGTCRSCATQCKDGMECPGDFLSIISRVRASCNKLIGGCQWNGKPFDCCANFLPLQTETGMCFTINSIHNNVYKNGSRIRNLIQLISNRKTGPGTLEFQAWESVKIFIHAPEDVPYFNHPQDEKESLFWGLSFNMRFQVTEIENDPQLRQVSVQQRNCRFPDENPLALHERYSYSTCLVECHAQYQMRFCNCTHHYMPNMRGLQMNTCDVAGLACLNAHSEELRSLKTEWSTKPGLACDCLSSCTEPEYSIIWKSSQPKDEQKDEGTKIRLTLDALPSTRFRRNVVRTRLDLVVSMGGTAGLFLGASLLTLVEVAYYALRRKDPSSPSANIGSAKSNASLVSRSRLTPPTTLALPNQWTTRANPTLVLPAPDPPRRANMWTNSHFNRHHCNNRNPAPVQAIQPVHFGYM